MIPRFELAAPGRILFGRGAVAEAGKAALALARGKHAEKARALLVSGGSEERIAGLLRSLDEAGLERVGYSIRREPRFEDAREALALARKEGCSVVLGCGGGSALDLVKAVAALLANPGDPLDYAELIGGGKALSEPSYPCVAIPTTAGTGSEASRNAVLVSEEQGVKVSLRSPGMLPLLAIVDPEMSYGMPPRLTAETGMDALTQLLEPFVCSSPNPLVDAICREALPRALRGLPRAFADGRDADAREDMAFASLSGGLALANARLGAVHGIAGPLGASLPIAHGAACAALLAPAMEITVAALRSRSPDNPVLGRYTELAALVCGEPAAYAEDLAPALRKLCAGLGIRGLASFGLERKAFSSLASKSAVSSSMRGNPIRLCEDEILAILEAAL
jgi:alcohol dehydrogenase class IV